MHLPAYRIDELRFVIATWMRRGIFAREEAQRVVKRWRGLEAGARFALLKVSFVPDHVHLAVRLHPEVAPASLLVELMNAGQEVMADECPASLIQAGVERLWQSSAYIGSFGELATPQIRRYLENWRLVESGGCSREPQEPQDKPGGSRGPIPGNWLAILGRQRGCRVWMGNDFGKNRVNTAVAKIGTI
jgi:REP element-mobilizing transposase RayT